MKHGMEIAVAAIIIIFAGVFLFQDAAGDKSWEGADGEAAELIEASGYEPWIEPFWEPPSCPAGRHRRRDHRLRLRLLAGRQEDRLNR